MTLEGSRDPLPAADDAGRARIELDNLFARPQPAVTVTVKKRRWSGVADDASRDHAPAAREGSPAPADGLAPQAPRTHRLAGPAPSAPSTDGVRIGAPVATAAPAARRTRATRNPMRRPGAVRIVVQAPLPRPAAAADQPAWQRILCAPPPPVSYREVLQALADVQQLLAHAQHAVGLRFDPA